MPRVTAPVTVVTGASRGIGRAIAQRLGQAGHRLVLVARSADGLRALAAELGAKGAEATAVAVDLRQPGAPEQVLAAAEAHFGPVTNVVNNAGTAPADKIENTGDLVLLEVLDLHVRVPLAFARGCAPTMKRAAAGCLLQVASTAGLRGFPFTAAYTAAKHGMVGLSRALHAELAPAGIAVYALCPGFVDTDITRAAAAAVAARGRSTPEQAFQRMAAQNRIGRMHTPDEVAAAATELLSQRPAGCVYDLDRDPPAFVD